MTAKKDDVTIGDTIELISMDDSMTRLKSGSRGTVSAIDTEQDLIWVDWENGERLALLKGIDKYKKIA